MTERRKKLSEKWTSFIYFITVNKYRFCISVIGYINVQIISISYKNQYRSITSYFTVAYIVFQTNAAHHLNISYIHCIFFVSANHLKHRLLKNNLKCHSLN